MTEPVVTAEMIEAATKSAREAAEKFAKDSGSKAGKIRSASQGLFEITDRDANSPDRKQVRVVRKVDYYLVDEQRRPSHPRTHPRTQRKEHRWQPCNSQGAK